MPALDVYPQNVVAGIAYGGRKSGSHSILWCKRPNVVNGVEELCMRFELSALGYSTVEGIQSLREASQFWIVSESDHEATV